MEPVFWIVAGLVVLIAGGELLVRGAVGLAATARISPLVIGLTVVAFGTSAPELAVSAQSCLVGRSELAVGNVVGSNIANVLLILGLSALVTPLVVSSQLVRFDVPLMVAAAVLMLVLGSDGSFGRLDGCLLFAGLVAYLLWSVVQSRKEEAGIEAEFASQLPAGRQRWWRQVGWILAGLVLLAAGSRWLVSGAVDVARQLGVSDLVIGLTIVAIGTSLPEVVTSVLASLRGQRDIAVGNVVGSNMFNILGVLGVSSIIAPTGIVASSDALHFDIPVMIAVSVACLPIFFTGHLIARWEGGVFFAYYLAYTGYLVLEATHSVASRTFGAIMIGYVVPLTVITLLVTVAHAVIVSRTKGLN